MLKVLIDLAILGLIGYFVYVKFFKKDAKKEDAKADPNEMIECDCCGLFIERKDMLKVQNHNYCSQICINKGVSK